jgi:hypothetical protein
MLLAAKRLGEVVLDFMEVSSLSFLSLFIYGNKIFEKALPATNY